MNIGLILDMAADSMGDRRAIGDLTYSEVRSAARGVASKLSEHASEPTSLASLMPNGPHLPIALFGAAWGGVSYAPINSRLPDAVRTELMDRLAPSALFDETWMLDETADAGTGADRSFDAEPVNPAVLLYTSGTTSAPKAAVLQHDNLMAYIFNTLEFASAGEDEAALVSVPPFHIAGVAAVLSSTYVGRRIVPLPKFTARGWLEAARDEGVTHAVVVPTMMARIVAELDADPALYPQSLRSLAYGGARMPTPVLERALELFPDVAFVNAYGLTETSSTVAVLGPEDHRVAFAASDASVRERLASCGRPVPGIEFSVHDGELWIRGDQIGGGYVGTASSVDADGWLHTGDQGYVDDDGYVFITGRADDLIIRGGENVSPSEIEDALIRHPDVVAAAVVGLPDAEWGERIAAMVVGARPDIDVVEIGRWVKGRIGSLKTPETIVVADDLPLTPSGKVMRRSVREALASP